MFVSTQMAGGATAYGATKLLGEVWTRQLGGQTARLWNIYDAEVSRPQSHVVADICLQALTTKKIKLLTTGEEQRQWLYAPDCAKALLHQRTIGQMYADITTGVWISVRTIAELVADYTGAEVSVSTAAGHEELREPEHLLRDWCPHTTWSQGLELTIDKMRKQLEGENNA